MDVFKVMSAFKQKLFCSIGESRIQKYSGSRERIRKKKIPPKVKINKHNKENTTTVLTGKS